MVTVNKKSAAVIAGIVLLLMQSPMPAWAQEAVSGSEPNNVVDASDNKFGKLEDLDFGAKDPETQDELIGSRKSAKNNLKIYENKLKELEIKVKTLNELVKKELEDSNNKTDKIEELEHRMESASESDFDRLNGEKIKLEAERKNIENNLSDNDKKLNSADEDLRKYNIYLQNARQQVAEYERKLKDNFGVNIDELDAEENNGQEETIKPDSPAPAPRTESDTTVDAPNDSTKSKEEVEKSIPEVKSPDTKVTEEKAVQEKDSVQTQPKDSKVDSRSSDNKFASSEYRSSQVESLESKKSKAKSVEAESTPSSSVAARPAESSVTPFAPVSEPKVIPQNATSKETPAASVENSQNASTVSTASDVTAASTNVSTPAASVAPATHAASPAPVAAQPASPVSHPAESEANNASSSEKADAQNNEENKKDENTENEDVKEDSKAVEEADKLSEAKSDNSKAPSNNNNLVVAGAVVGTMAIGGSAAAGIYMSRGGKIRFSK